MAMVFPVRSDTDLISGRANRRAISRSVLFGGVGVFFSASVAIGLFAIGSRAGFIVAVVSNSATAVAANTCSCVVLVLEPVATAPVGRESQCLLGYYRNRQRVLQWVERLRSLLVAFRSALAPHVSGNGHAWSRVGKTASGAAARVLKIPYGTRPYRLGKCDYMASRQYRRCQARPLV